MNVKDLIPIIPLTCLCGDLVIVAVNSNVGICGGHGLLTSPICKSPLSHTILAYFHNFCLSCFVAMPQLS